MANSNEYMNNYMKNRYKKRRSEAIDKLGGKCVVCGTTQDLEFDHIEPHTKEITIARASSFSESRWQAEIAKCQLLCHTCHVEKHRPEHLCGDVKKYWQGCRCNLCKAARNNHHKEWKRRSKST